MWTSFNDCDDICDPSNLKTVQEFPTVSLDFTCGLLTTPSHKSKTHIKTLTCRAVSNLVSAMFTCAVVLDLLLVILDDRAESQNTSAAV